MSDLTYAAVVRILNLIDSAEGSDMDLRLDDVTIKITRGTARAKGALIVRTASAKQVDAAPVQAQVIDPHPDAAPVSAPMGGMFYAASAPGQPPFARIGQAVTAGDQLGIVEVMKLFTPITAPVDGTLVAILVEDQQTIAKDEVLMRIETGK